MVFASSFLLFLPQGAHAQMDSVRLTRDQVILFEDSVFVPTSDTVVTVPAGLEYQIKQNQYYLSEQFYESMKSNAEKVILLGDLYNFLVSYRPPEDVFETRKPVESVEEFTSFEGKRIKSIDIIYVDLGVGSVTDTSIHATGGLAKAFNDIHIHTRKQVIMNNILFTEGDQIDPFRISDSERLLRSLSYVEDARIQVRLDPQDPEGVYLSIVVKDRFPWGVDASFSSLKKWGLGINNRNILGYGDLLSAKYMYSQKDIRKHGYELRFQSRNIRRTFFNLSAFLADNHRRRGWEVAVSREFVSPQIRWGGQLALGDLADFEDVVFADSLLEEDVDIRSKYVDGWLAHAFPIADRTNFTLAGRYWHSDYISRPPVAVDFNERLHDRDLFIGAVGINKLNYFKTRNIRSFNITEDAPVGFLGMFLYGRDIAEFETRDYLGGQLAGAIFNDAGYFGLNLEAGTFLPIDRGGTKNDVFELRGAYFTPLIKWHRTYIRNFLRANLFISDDLSIPFTRSLRDDNRIRNISGQQLQGNQMINISLESVFFLPGYIYGFRFAPYFLCDYGAVKENRIELGYENSYVGIGSGLRIRNESLVLDTFEMRFVYFPLKPPEGDTFRIKISTSAPVIFRTFNVNKPTLAVFE